MADQRVRDVSINYVDGNFETVFVPGDFEPQIYEGAVFLLMAFGAGTLVINFERIRRMSIGPPYDV